LIGFECVLFAYVCYLRCGSGANEKDTADDRVGGGRLWCGLSNGKLIVYDVDTWTQESCIDLADDSIVSSAANTNTLHKCRDRMSQILLK